METEFLYICPNCEHKNSAEKWNETTKLNFGGEIVPIDNPTMIWARYKCPHCGSTYDGDKIIIEKIPIILVLTHPTNNLSFQKISIADFIIIADYENGIYEVIKDRYNVEYSKGYIETGKEVPE